MRRLAVSTGNRMSSWARRCSHGPIPNGKQKVPGLYPNAHLLSWSFQTSLLSTTGKGTAHARALRSIQIIPTSALETAASIVDTSSARRHAFSPIDFYEPSSKRCVLCGTILSGSYAAHESYVEHVARVGIVERAIALLLHHLEGSDTSDDVGEDTPWHTAAPTLNRHNVAHWTCEEVVAWLDAHWWAGLNPSPSVGPLGDEGTAGTAASGELDGGLSSFSRLPTLSAATQRARMQRLRFLLATLKDVGVLRHSLMAGGITSAAAREWSSLSRRGAVSAEDGGYARGDLFQRFEMIGDNVMKVMMPDRLQAMFPFTEGGVDSRLQTIQRLLDSNQGLLEIYNALNLNALVGANLANSKAKSDVVEAIFGELQAFVWAVQSRTEAGEYSPALPCRTLLRVSAVAEHALNELMHVLMMWSATEALRNVFPLLRSSILTPFEAQRRRRRQQAVHPRGLSSSPSDRTAPNELLEAYMQRASGRPSHQSLLPLLSPSAMPHYLSDALVTGRDWWLHSTHNAPTRASACQEGPRLLSPTPCPISLVLHHHYTAATAPSLSTRLASPNPRADGHTQCHPPLTATPTSPVQYPMSETTVNALQWELVESYPWPKSEAT